MCPLFDKSLVLDNLHEGAMLAFSLWRNGHGEAVGIGGVFFRAKDNSALAHWYATHLGVEEFWTQMAGFTVFSPFKETSDYFPADKQWMINFRVDDLEALMGQLRAAGIAIETRDEWDSPETGRFARIHDPEGNPIELWEPPPPAPTA